MTSTDPGQPTVRERAARDLPGAADALVSVHASDGYPVEGVDDHMAWLIDSHQIRAWVAELDGRIVGHVALSEPQRGDAAAALWTASPAGQGGRVAVLGRLFVRPDARGHALGERLICAATNYSREHRRRLVLDVMAKDAAAASLCKRLGWTRIGTTRHDDGHGHAIDALCYVGPEA